MKISADYRMLALDALRGKWKTAVLTGIAASALGATIVSSSNSVVSNSNQAKDIHFNLFAQPNGGRLLAVLLVGIGLWAILQLIVGGAVQLGYAHFNLNLVDGNDAAISDLFSQKDRLWDGFCMKFLQGLYIALWSLLLVIPGIVKTYSYAMTPYIMSEHPSLTQMKRSQNPGGLWTATNGGCSVWISASLAGSCSVRCHCMPGVFWFSNISPVQRLWRFLFFFC